MRPPIAISLLAALATVAPAARAGTSFAFPFEDARWLAPPESDGGLAYVPDAVADGSIAPVVVLLHGINDKGPLHRWLGGASDLRPFVDRLIASERVEPFVLAAPSQTRDAGSGRTLFDGFDLESFLDATDDALGERAIVDRSRIVVVGHSGGGCNPDGGLLAVADADLVPLGVVAIDTCLDAPIGTILGSLATRTTVEVFWQRQTWARDFDAFERAFEDASGRSDAGRLEQLGGYEGNPHEAIVKDALERSLSDLLPARDE